MEVSGESHAPATVPMPEEARNTMEWVPELLWTFTKRKLILSLARWNLGWSSL